MVAIFGYPFLLLRNTKPVNLFNIFFKKVNFLAIMSHFYFSIILILRRTP